MAFNFYKIDSVVADGIIAVMSPEYGTQLWVLSNTNNRKNQQCAICKSKIKMNTQRMYRPMGNPSNRMYRICANCGNR